MNNAAAAVSVSVSADPAPEDAQNESSLDTVATEFMMKENIDLSVYEGAQIVTAFEKIQAAMFSKIKTVKQADHAKGIVLSALHSAQQAIEAIRLQTGDKQSSISPTTQFGGSRNATIATLKRMAGGYTGHARTTLLEAAEMLAEDERRRPFKQCVMEWARHYFNAGASVVAGALKDMGHEDLSTTAYRRALKLAEANESVDDSTTEA